jgi:phosphotransacetylase
MLARLRNAQAIGPILLGFCAPVRVLQTGDDVENVVHLAMVVAVCTQTRER